MEDKAPPGHPRVNYCCCGRELDGFLSGGYRFPGCPRTPGGKHERERRTAYFLADVVPYWARRLLGGHARSTVRLVAGKGSGTEFSSA